MADSDNSCDDDKRINQDGAKGIETNHEAGETVSSRGFTATSVTKLLNMN